MSLLSLDLSLLNGHDGVLKLRDGTANARPAFSWCLFIVMAERKKKKTSLGVFKAGVWWVAHGSGRYFLHQFQG